MIYLLLFWTFFKIGLFTIGGGAAMLPLIQQEVIGNGWLSEEMLINIVGIAESTPGPIAINVSTYVGSTQGGILGSICATLGMVTPSFVIILIIAKFFTNILNHRLIVGALDGVQPVIFGLIIATGAYYALKSIFPDLSVQLGQATIDWRAFGILFGLIFCEASYMLWKKKTIPPIAIIISSAVLGMVVYAF